MTDNHEHTPTVDELRRMYALKVPHDQRDRRNAEFDRFIAAAEQRGAERALREAAKDWRWSAWADAPRNPIAAANYTGDWIENRADQEGDE